jgi:hypothetical protein
MTFITLHPYTSHRESISYSKIHHVHTSKNYVNLQNPTFKRLQLDNCLP